MLENELIGLLIKIGFVESDIDSVVFVYIQVLNNNNYAYFKIGSQYHFANNNDYAYKTYDCQDMIFYIKNLFKHKLRMIKIDKLLS